MFKKLCRPSLLFFHLSPRDDDLRDDSRVRAVHALSRELVMGF
jgi:hypothetical protein